MPSVLYKALKHTFWRLRCRLALINRMAAIDFERHEDEESGLVESLNE